MITIKLLTILELVLLSVTMEMVGRQKEYISVLIDGYTHNTTLDSGDTVQLGTTVILVCSVTGIPYGVQTSYRWTCPHGICNIGSHILKIPLISTSDGGDYTCTVLADGINNNSAVFTFTAKQPTSGFIVTSQNRSFDHEAVITNITEIAEDQEIGEIQCRSYNGGNATWVRPGYTIPTSPTEDVYSENGSTATLFVKRISNTSDDYYCTDNDTNHNINLYLSNNTLPIPAITFLREEQENITFTVCGSRGKYVTRYDRLDLGVPVEVGHVEDSNKKVSLSVVPGGLYRVKVWSINEQNIGLAPNEATYRAKSSVPTKPRHLTITRVCKDDVELNWIPPREPNGELHYIIQYGSNTTNTASNLTYYNLTGLVNGTTYYITVMAVNSAGSGTSNVMKYTHLVVNGLTNTLTPSPTTQIVKDHIPSSSASPPSLLPALTIRVGRIGDTADVMVTPTIGQPVQMECERSGTPKNWYSAGSVVTPTPGEVATTGGGGGVRTLSISHFSSTHAGTYTCIVGPNIADLTFYTVVVMQTKTSTSPVTPTVTYLSTAVGSVDWESILPLSVVATALCSVLITSIIWSILTYYCCVKKKQNQSRDLKRQENENDIYDTINEQDEEYGDIMVHQSPAYETVGNYINCN